MKPLLLPTLLAFSLSLSLAACQHTTPNTQSGSTDSNTLASAQPLPTSFPALTKTAASGSLRLQNNTLTLTLNLPELPDTPSFKTQKLDLSTTTKLFAQVSDSHGKTYAPSGADGDGAINYTGGTITLTFNNLTPDELLFVDVQAKNGTTPIPQADLATVIKHTTDTSPISAALNFQTAVAAKALKAMLPTHATQARGINLTTLNTLTTSITGVSGTAPNLTYSQNHPSLVNTALLATHLQSQAPNTLTASNYRQSGATVNLTVTGLAGSDKVQVQITDAASAVRTNLGNGSTNITGITPGSGLTAIVTPFGTPTQTYNYSINPTNLSLTEGNTTNLTVTATPTMTLTNISPAAGPAGTLVTITGTGFTGATAVNFNGSPAASFTVNSDAQITATVPVTATDGTISVTKGGTTKYSTDFDVYRRIYVNTNASGSNNGSTWANAYNSLQTALTAAGSGDEIWVAAGKYTPAAINGNRATSFVIKSGVSLYGGFAGNETQISQRILSTHRVTLSGDLNSNDNYLTSPFTGISENTLFVVEIPSGAHNVVIDGVTIEGGYNNDNTYSQAGAGIRSVGDLDLKNSIITHNSANDGAGIFFDGSQVLPARQLNIENSFFINNQSTARGAGISVTNYSIFNAYNSVFNNNLALAASDIDIFSDTIEVNLYNLTFSHPSNTYAIYAPGLTNGKNLLFWNTSINGTITGDGNVEATVNPFVNALLPFGSDGLPFTSDDGLRISPSATSILNTGTNAGAPTTDILGNPRPGSGNANAEPGAYEYTP